MNCRSVTRGRGFRASGVITVLIVGLSLAVASAQTITFATHYNDEQIAPALQCVKQYEAENPGVKVVHQQITYGDYLQTILTSRIGGQAPDIYHLYQVWAPQIVSNDVLAIPPADVLDWLNDTYLDMTLQAATIDGQIWGVPTEVSNYMLLYNKKLLAAAGYDSPPTTWEELTEIAAAITQRDSQGNITVAGYAWGPTVANVVHPFLTLLYSAGVEMFKPDFSGTNLTAPEAVDALEKQSELYARGITDATVGTNDFSSNGVGMITHASWTKAGYEDAYGDQFADTIGVGPIPGGDDWRSLQYIFFYAVDANSPNKDQAWHFIRWLNSPQVAGSPSCMGNVLFTLGALTGNKADLEAGKELLDDAFTAPFVAALERSVPEPIVMQSSEIEGILQRWILRAWNGEVSAADALNGADREITAILREFY